MNPLVRSGKAHGSAMIGAVVAATRLAGVKIAGVKSKDPKMRLLLTRYILIKRRSSYFQCISVSPCSRWTALS